MAVVELAATAELLGELLLVELSPARCEQLHEPVVASALQDLGVVVPAADELELLAVDFFDRFVNPQSGFPLVQSLYEGGTYEGDAARAVGRVAEAAGLEYTRSDAMGAPFDHVGSELVLWARLVVRDEDAAAEFATRHLAWAVPILLRCAERAADDGPPFNAQVAAATAEFIESSLPPGT